jgi:hypothetical protein
LYSKENGKSYKCSNVDVDLAKVDRYLSFPFLPYPPFPFLSLLFLFFIFPTLVSLSSAIFFPGLLSLSYRPPAEELLFG